MIWSLLWLHYRYWLDTLGYDKPMSKDVHNTFGIRIPLPTYVCINVDDSSCIRQYVSRHVCRVGILTVLNRNQGLIVHPPSFPGIHVTKFQLEMATLHLTKRFAYTEFDVCTLSEGWLQDTIHRWTHTLWKRLTCMRKNYIKILRAKGPKARLNTN